VGQGDIWRMCQTKVRVWKRSLTRWSFEEAMPCCGSNCKESNLERQRENIMAFHTSLCLFVPFVFSPPQQDAPIKDWVQLAVGRAKATGVPAVFWLDANRAHDAQLIVKVCAYTKDLHLCSGDYTLPYSSLV